MLRDFWRMVSQSMRELRSVPGADEHGPWEHGERESGMSYVTKTLLPSEDVLYRAKIHWFVYAPGFLLICAAVFLFNYPLPEDEKVVASILGFFTAVVGVVVLLKSVIVRTTTEMAITTKRVIAKTGFVKRSTVELNHSKLESIAVEQSILGRVFGFGTLVINGTGGGKTHVPNIDAPLQFRRVAMQVADPV